jgi:predicted nuclease of restriction endonuclease-like (RecB) superfamily
MSVVITSVRRMYDNGVSDAYGALLDEICRHLALGRARARASINEQRQRTYHAIGSAIVARQHEQGWGAQVIDRLAGDLRVLFPGQRGLSPRSLRYMHSLAVAWPDADFATAVAQLPWGHVVDLLDRLPTRELRDWYASQALTGGWSRGLLQDRIKGQLHRRVGAAPSNFGDTLPPDDSALAQQVTRDPVLLEFLGLTGPTRERELERAMVDVITATMLELGDGAAALRRHRAQSRPVRSTRHRATRVPRAGGGRSAARPTSPAASRR